ncbi:hypothetical protein QYE76_060330 [Lolium multiflorum]|uniref:Uncharacterized protein n=1 Tax=Lolium multiflorum TaxID=4521 RepID=A0AAD8S117_LOLMU|nr:hypothetical protein QYE76_060330 [Lolium multiflorum]
MPVPHAVVVARVEVGLVVNTVSLTAPMGVKCKSTTLPRAASLRQSASSTANRPTSPTLRSTGASPRASSLPPPATPRSTHFPSRDVVWVEENERGFRCRTPILVDFKEIVSMLRHIKDKAHKDGVQNQQAISR